MDGDGLLHMKVDDGVNSYQGGFKYGKFEGDGIFTWHSGKKCEGRWANGVQDGIGYFTSAFGKRKKGEWKQG